jgi:hypothetical protein
MRSLKRCAASGRKSAVDEDTGEKRCSERDDAQPDPALTSVAWDRSVADLLLQCRVDAQQFIGAARVKRLPAGDFGARLQRRVINRQGSSIPER